LREKASSDRPSPVPPRLPVHDEDGEILIRVWGLNRISEFQLRNMGLERTGKAFPGGLYYRQR
jgi:hypothetical protein